MFVESEAIKKVDLLRKIERLATSYEDRLIFEMLLDAVIKGFLLQNDYVELLSELEKIKERDREEFSELFKTFFIVQRQAVEEQGFADIVGVLWQELNLQNSRLGQFYTPWPVVRFMVMSSFSPAEIEKANEEFRPYRFLDPACGSGRFSIGFNSLVVDYYEKEQKMLWVDYTNIDIDLLAVKMTVVNMLLHNMRGRVYWGNALEDSYRAEFCLKPSGGLTGVIIFGEGKFPFTQEIKKQIQEIKEQKQQTIKQLKLWT